ncbi:MAG: GGDEF domain-containing protein [Ancalomicrobiaceae bacterium]|nr:GGDEF domain-containing protein [Ancalomicrobiaceae bacterium]
MTTKVSKALRNWILRQVELGALTRQGAHWTFARKLAINVTIGAVAIDCLSRLALASFGLLPYPLISGFVYGTLITVASASFLSLVFGLAVGKAIVDLTITRTEFERLSRTDMLSSLLNRRAFTEHLKAVAPTAILAVFDIDRFKTINDRFGHPVGDRVITAVAATLAIAFAGPHTVARIGGEEFGVIISGLSAEASMALVEAARAAVAALVIPLAGSTVAATVSAGMAAFAPDRDPDAVFAAADRALYLAKAAGRNIAMHEDDIYALIGTGRFRTDPTPRLIGGR